MHLSSHRNLRGATALALSAILATTGAQAADGTWTQLSGGNASGTWSDAIPANWAGGIVAGGAGFTADFSTIDITVNSTVALGASRTIGNLIFGDTASATAVNWTLSNGGNAANVLTLAGTTPTVTVNTTGTTVGTTISASISGTSGLTKAGTGLLVLSGSNNYSGGTTISTGALKAANGFSLGSGDVTVASGAGLHVQSNMTLANALNLNGTTALTLVSGTVSLSGPVSLQSASTIALGSANNSAMEITGNLNLGSNNLTVNGGKNLTLSGAINGSGNIILGNTGGTTIITNDNSATYSGQTSVGRTSLAVGNNGALGTGTLAFGVNDQNSAIRSTDTTTRTLANVVTLVGSLNSTYDFGSTNASFNGNLVFTNTTSISLGTATKKFQVRNRTQFDAGFTGGNGITMQTGTGTLVLNGVNAYTGATTVNAGTLLVNGLLAGGSAVTVATAGTLGGSGTIGGATTVNGVLTPGEDGIAGNLSFASSLNIQGITTGIGALKFDLGTTSDMVTLTGGALTIGSGLLEWDDFTFTALAGFAPGTYTLISTTQAISGSLGSNLSGTISGMDATISFADGGTDIVLTVVPEPSVCLLAGAGLVSVLFLRRRKA